VEAKARASEMKRYEWEREQAKCGELESALGSECGQHSIHATA
jgi:hypothetical protein